MFILLMVRLTRADVRSVISTSWNSSSDSFSGSSSGGILMEGGRHMESLLCLQVSDSILSLRDGPWKEDTSDSACTHNVLSLLSEKDVWLEVSWNEIDSYP